MVMMGDFNYHINWEEMEGERKEDRKFIDMVNDTFLQQHVEETTREGSKYILDLILMVKKRPWVTRKVQKKRRAKQRAWRKYSKLKKENEVSNSDLADQIRELKQKYVEKRNLSNRANREAVKDYENKLAANVKSDSKSFYKYVRSRQRKKDRVGPITDNQGKVLIKDEEVAEAINKYFGSVYEKEEGGDVPVA